MLRIFNPEEVGVLSPNFITNLNLTGDQAATAIGYIYAGILEKGSAQRGLILSYIDPDQIQKVSMEFFDHYQDKVYYAALRQAYDSKFSTKLLRTKFLETYPREIRYKGFAGDHLGEYLTGYRNKLYEDEVNFTRQYQKLFNTCLEVYFNLQKKLLNKNDPLSKYLNKSAEELVEELQIKIDNAAHNIPVELTNQIDKFVRANGYGIPEYLRRKYLDKIIKAREVENETLIKDAYLNYFIRNANKGGLNENYFKNEVYSHFSDKKFAKELSEIFYLNIDNIQDRIKPVLLPRIGKYLTDNDKEYPPVRRELKLNVPIKPKLTSTANYHVEDAGGTEIVFINDEHEFSPMYTSMFQVNGESYPTIMNYINIKLLESLNTRFPDFETARKKYLVNPKLSGNSVDEWRHPLFDPELMTLYKTNKILHIREVLKKRTKHVIDFLSDKYDYISLIQDYLPLDRILYDSATDLYLGTGVVSEDVKGGPPEYDGLDLYGTTLQVCLSQKMEPLSPPWKNFEKGWIQIKLLDVLESLIWLKKCAKQKSKVVLDDVNAVIQIYVPLKILNRFITIKEEGEVPPHEVIRFIKNNLPYNITEEASHKLWLYVLFLRKTVDIMSGGKSFKKFINYCMRETNKEVSTFDEKSVEKLVYQAIKQLVSVAQKHYGLKITKNYILFAYYTLTPGTDQMNKNLHYKLKATVISKEEDEFFTPMLGTIIANLLAQNRTMLIERCMTVL